MMIDKNINLIKTQIKKHQFSGVCSIKQGNHKILEETNGFLDWANRIPINTHTRFGIASGTKLFTALGIMKMIEKGKCHLDDTIFKYIPKQFPTYNQNITIQHLLTHTSGIPDYLDEEKPDDVGHFFVEKPWYEFNKPTDYLSILPQTKMVYEPGSRFKYNDSAFVLLAVIIEVITGDYHGWIEKEVLQKAEMNHSGFFKLNQLPENTAYGYKNIDKKPYETNVYNLPIIGGGDGGMFTTAHDMNLFWEHFINGKIVKPKLVEVMLKPYAKGKDLSYGLGLWLQEDRGGFVPLIIGEDCGVSFESGYHPTKRLTYTIISNTQDGVWPISQLIF